MNYFVQWTELTLLGWYDGTEYNKTIHGPLFAFLPVPARECSYPYIVSYKNTKAFILDGDCISRSFFCVESIENNDDVYFEIVELLPILFPTFLLVALIFTFVCLVKTGKINFVTKSNKVERSESFGFTDVNTGYLTI